MVESILMKVFLLNESKDVSQLGSGNAFLTLDEVSSYIEPVDVDNGEFFLCDSDGQFYSILSTKSFDRFMFTKAFVNAHLARKLFRDYLQSVGENISELSDMQSLAKRLIERIESGDSC
jgi:hypothetical protein